MEEKEKNYNLLGSWMQMQRERKEKGEKNYYPTCFSNQDSDNEQIVHCEDPALPTNVFCKDINEIFEEEKGVHRRNRKREGKYILNF